MQLFIGTLALLLLAIPTVVLSQSGSSCFTTTGEQGSCVPPHKCQFVRDLLVTFGGSLPRSIQNEIREQVCYGGPRAQFHMCCPSAAVLEPQSNVPKETSTTAPKTKSPNTGRKTTQNLRYIDPQGLQLLDSITECGKKSNIKLSNGETTKIGEFPWLALLKYRTSGRPFLCGGSLITDRFVLTAAHCTRGQVDLIGVRLGEHNLSTEKDCQLFGGRRTECLPPYEEYGIEEIRVHPMSEEGSISYDIALLKLDRRVQFNTHIKPICLPIDRTSQNIAYDQSFYISGWGTTEKNAPSDVLLKALVKRQDLDVCRNYYEEAPVTENHICAVSEGAQHTCRGDSGGPVFFLHPYKRTARYVQYAVISFGGRRCGLNKNEPGVFASVLDMLPWITQNLH